MPFLPVSAVSSIPGTATDTLPEASKRVVARESCCLCRQAQEFHWGCSAGNFSQRNASQTGQPHTCAEPCSKPLSHADWTLRQQCFSILKEQHITELLPTILPDFRRLAKNTKCGMRTISCAKNVAISIRKRQINVNGYDINETSGYFSQNHFVIALIPRF